MEITGDHVARLGDEDLRRLIAKLCEAELRRANLPAAAVQAGGNQTAMDGGVDVRVELTSGVGNLDFIPRPRTVFQSKCEDMPPSKVTDEMRPGGKLRPIIKELIAGGGAYVIVSSKGTVSDAFLRKRVQAMKDALADQADAAQLLVAFYDRDRLARWVRQYAGVEMWLRDRVNDRIRGWEGYAPWAGAGAGGPYLHDDSARLKERVAGGAPISMSVSAGIDRLRATLSTPGNVSRIVGLAGTGKTRLVQALFEEGVGTTPALDTALVLYTDIGHEPEPNAREMMLRLGGMEQRTIFVVDNCNPATHQTLAQVVRQHTRTLSLLTVEYDVAEDDSPEGTDVFELEKATAQVLERILERLAPQLTAPDRSQITEFAGGNARVALALANTVARGETLGVLNDGELFRRLFRQNQAESPELLRAAEACSLVYSFEGEDVDSQDSELRVLARLARMDARELYRHVDTLRRRDLAQSRGKWRAVLPPALANRLAKSALSAMPRSDVLDAWSSSERLLMSFTRRLQYLHNSAEARAVAIGWLDDPNWLGNPGRLNDFGRRLFFYIAPVEPAKVLAVMERALGDDKLAEFLTEQKQHLNRWAALLRYLAYEPPMFERAATLLLSLADGEEGNTHERRSAFTEMFRGVLSGTLAPPAQRAQLLGRLVSSSTGKRQELVWNAAESMLQASHVSSSHDFSFGARLHGFGWEPANSQDVAAWFDAAFQVLEQLSSLGPAGRERARSAVASHFREVWACGVHHQLAALARRLAADGGWPAGWIAVRSTLRFDSKGMAPEAVAELNELEQALAPRGIVQEIRTYTFGQTAALMDVSVAVEGAAEDKSQDPVSAWQRISENVTQLGVAAASQDQVLLQVMPELLGEHGGRQFSFGYGLGQGTRDSARHWELLSAACRNAENPNVGLVSGFFQGLRSRDSAAAEQLLESIGADPKLDTFYPAIMGAPRDDADGDRLLAAMRRGRAKPQRFGLCTRTGENPGLSLGKFCETVDALSQMVEGGLDCALDELATELHNWGARKTSPPAELVHLARTLLGRFTFSESTQNQAWRLNEVALLALEGPDGASAAAQFAQRFAAALEDYRTSSDDFGELACTLFKLQPTVALDAFFSEPKEERHFLFRHRFIMRHGHVVQCAPEDVIVDWVRLDPAKRAPLLAAEIDILDSPTSDAGFSPLASRLLDLLQDKGPVLSAFTLNFNPISWSGSLGQTLAPFVSLLKNLSGHHEQWLAAWARDNLAAMRKRIESERLFEDRREQSFE